MAHTFILLAMLVQCQSVAAFNMMRVQKFTDPACDAVTQAEDTYAEINKCGQAAVDRWYKLSCSGAVAISTLYSDSTCTTVLTNANTEGYVNGIYDNNDACTTITGGAQIAFCENIQAIKTSGHTDAACTSVVATTQAMALNKCEYSLTGPGVFQSKKYAMSATEYTKTVFATKDCTGTGTVTGNGILPCFGSGSTYYKMVVAPVDKLDTTSSSLPQSLPAAAMMLAMGALGLGSSEM